MWIWQFIQSLKEATEETTSTIRWFLGVVLVLAAIGVAFDKWIVTLNPIGIASFYVGIGVLILIGVTFLLDWNRKQNIYRIPDLLALIDQLTLDYIEDYDPGDIPEEVADDLAKLLGMGDIGQLKAAVKAKNKKQIDVEMARIMSHYNNLINPKKPQEAVQSLLLLSGFLNSHNIGLKIATDTPSYHKLYDRIKRLQRKVPSAVINMKVNEYWKWSEGLYSIILSAKPLTSLEGLRELMPPKYLATSSQLRPQIQDFTTVLISGVRESIETYKERDKGDKEKTPKKK